MNTVNIVEWLTVKQSLVNVRCFKAFITALCTGAKRLGLILSGYVAINSVRVPDYDRAANGLKN